MTKPKNQLFCRLDGLTPLARKERRAIALNKLGLLSSEAFPVLEETTQKAATFSGAPIAILGLVVEDELWFKSAVGLSTIGLTTELAARRKIPLEESFSTYVVDSQQPLVIENTLAERVFANSVLTQHYGIKAYLGVPLISFRGVCIGTLSVMDWTARKFDDRDIDHLTLLARYCLGELERDRLHQSRSPWQQSDMVSLSFDPKPSEDRRSKSSEDELQAQVSPSETTTDPIKLKLVSQLTQELKTPLTSVIGMTSVLHQGVYGPLTDKQREYLEIIHNSGQNLIALVDEIVSLGVLNDRSSDLELAATDIEMLCQQVISSLADVAKQHQQELRLSIEPGNRIWSLDREKVRQAVYYSIASVIEMSEPGGEVKIHVSKRDRILNIAVEAFHPWLGADFGEVRARSQHITKALSLNSANKIDRRDLDINNTLSGDRVLTTSSLMMAIDSEKASVKSSKKVPRELLGLLFCCHLMELHEGRVVVRGSSSNYRYLLQFPKARLEIPSVAENVV